MCAPVHHVGRSGSRFSCVARRKLTLATPAGCDALLLVRCQAALLPLVLNARRRRRQQVLQPIVHDTRKLDTMIAIATIKLKLDSTPPTRWKPDRCIGEAR